MTIDWYHKRLMLFGCDGETRTDDGRANRSATITRIPRAYASKVDGKCFSGAKWCERVGAKAGRLTLELRRSNAIADSATQRVPPSSGHSHLRPRPATLRGSL